MNPGILASGHSPPPMPYGQTRLAGVIPRQINPDALVFVFDTSLEPANNTVSVPLNGTVNCTIDWGDGTREAHTTTGYKTKTYANPGVYVVQITGTMTTLTYGSGTTASNNRTKLVRCLSFGNVGLTSANSAFRSCNNLIEVPSSLPRILTNLQFMFQSATKFNHPIGSWDTSLVAFMSGMFSGATAFNQPIGSWDTSANTSLMSNVFSGATAFNQDISGWNTAGVTNMTSMFQGATSFNQPIGSWDVSKVTNMNSMFSGATAFNQPIGSWDVSKVFNMPNVFSGATAFNQDISAWDIRQSPTLTMFSASGWGNANYSAALIAWNALPDTNVYNSVSLTAASSDAGGVLFTAATGHEMQVGATVTITGTTDYNGTYRVNSVPTATSFVVSATFVSTQTGTMQQRRLGGVFFNAGSAKYSAAAAASRSTLIDTYNWSITDGGAE